jgi:hypothetical protein
MYFLKYLTQSKISLSVRKSFLLRQKLLNDKTNNSFKLRLKTFLSVFLIPIFIIRRIKRTTAQHIILDSFIAAHHLDLRMDFVVHFDKDIQKGDVVVANHQYFYYRKLSFDILLKFFGIWLKFSTITFINLFQNNKYPTIYYYYVATNLINAVLTQPKKIFLFQMYDTSTYLSALILQNEYKNVFLSVSNSVIYPFNRYTTLDKSNIILCNRYQEEEIANFVQNGWFKSKKLLLWGPEEITEHNAIPIHPPQFDVGLYSSGYWARVGRNREYNINAIRSYQHIDNIYYQEFLTLLDKIIEIRNETGITVKIYTHPLERDWYNDHQIKPPYWDLADQHGLIVDLSGGNSLSKLYEVNIGISTISTILLDRWHHGLNSLILHEEENNKDYYRVKYFGSYSRFFVENLDNLKPLILEQIKDLK